MSCENQQARPDREATCRKCRGDRKHRVIGQHDASSSDEEIGQEWTHHALLQCRGCGTISYEYSFEFTDNLNEDGTLYTTRRSYPPPDDELPEGVVVLLMTDIVDSTELTEKLGDAAFRDKAARLHRESVNAIRYYDGKPVKGMLLGDGVLAVFTSTANALAAAIKCVKRATANDFQLHVGVHAGEVQTADQNVFGGAVNTVARVTGKAQPDEVLVTNTVKDLARTSSNLNFDERGKPPLKGIKDPPTLFSVRRDDKWEEVEGIDFP